MKTLASSYFKPKVYLSAKVRKPNHERNNTVVSYLRGIFDIFIPHAHQCDSDNHEDVPISVYYMDLTAMEHCDLCVLVPPFGKDCAYEVGWLVAKDKPVFLYANETTDFLSDAMVCGGVTAVFTPDMKIYQRLMVHPVLRFKTYYLSEPNDLGREVLQFYNDMNNGKILMENV